MSSPNNYLLLIEYDGARFSGWQKQPGALTIQGEIEKALRKLGLNGAETTAAGRTDKGVHAAGQAVTVSFNKDIGGDFDLRYRLNAVLPKDISVTSAEKKKRSFNPRFDAKKKLYRYVIWNKPWRSVWNARNAWHIAQPLNIPAMKKASSYLAGRHDFSAFDASGSTQADKIVNLGKIDIASRSGKVTISLAGDRFLYKMVRNIVGTLVEVGRSRLLPEGVKKILLGGNRKAAGPTAPAKGLFLEEVKY